MNPFPFSMEQLEFHGKIIRKYTGQGNLNKNNQLFKCKFQVAQLSDGRIIGFADIATDIYDDIIKLSEIITSDWRKNITSYISISGTTKNGQNLEFDETRITGTTREVFEKFLKVRFSSRNLNICSINLKREEYTKIHFGLTNLEFIGSNRRDKFTVNIEDLNLTFKYFPKYEEIIRELKTTKKPYITSNLIIPISNKVDLEKIIEVVDNVCILLSFATGNLIKWIYYDIYCGNKRVKSCHRHTLTRPFTRGESVISDESRNIKNFLENCYSNYLKNKDEYNLRLAIEYYVDSRCQETMQIKFISGSTAMEVLKSNKFTIQNFIPEKEFKKKAEKFELSKKIIELFKECFPDPNDLKNIENEIFEKNIKDKILELNRKSFKILLKKMFKHLDINNYELNFIGLRNKIIHTGEIGKDPKIFHQKCKMLINLLERTILKILGYDCKV